VHRVRKFVEVASGRIGYAMTEAALSEASNGAKWNPDPSFSVADALLADPEFCFSAERGLEGRPCYNPSARGEMIIPDSKTGHKPSRPNRLRAVFLFGESATVQA
jgi:hypothetical protein